MNLPSLVPPINLNLVHTWVRILNPSTGVNSCMRFALMDYDPTLGQGTLTPISGHRSICRLDSRRFSRVEILTLCQLNVR